MNRPELPPEEGLKLPFDLRTLAVSIAGRWWQFILIAMVAVVVAWDLGHRLGGATYVSRTVLLYAPATDINVEIGESTFLNTHVNMVKIPENLEVLREELGLSSTLASIGGALDAKIQKNTGLLVLTATWDDALGAAELANGIRDIFLRRHVELMAAGELRALNHQREKRIQARSSADKQLEELRLLGTTIRSRMQVDIATDSSIEGLGNMNIRIERLRDAIDDDQSFRANQARLTKMELELARVESLAQDGLMAKSQVEKARSDYSAQKAITIDTEQTKEWRAELQKLQDSTIPKDGKVTSPSAPILQEILLKEFNLELEKIQLADSIIVLDDRIQEVNQALTDSLPAPRDQAAGLNFFRIVSDAEVPVFPETSSKKLIAIAVAIMLTGLGAFLIILRVLTDRRILSMADSKAKLGISARVGWRKGKLPSAVNGVDDDFLLLANQLRPFAGEARCFLALAVEEDQILARAVGQLASAAAQLGERVLIINGSTRPTLQPFLETELCGQKLAFGLDQALAGLPEGQSVWPESEEIKTGCLHIFENGGRIPRPEDLASLPFRELLLEARSMYSMTIVLGPDPTKTRQTILLAENCDQTLIVLRASRMKAGKIKTALEPLLSQGERLGVVLGEIRPKYASLSDAA